MSPPLVVPEVDQAKEMIAKIEEEEKVLIKLKEATAARDREALTKWLLEASDDAFLLLLSLLTRAVFLLFLTRPPPPRGGGVRSRFHTGRPVTNKNVCDAISR